MVRGASAMEWLRDKNPFKSPSTIPYLPEQRPRPLTPTSPELNGAKDSQLFNKLPSEIRSEIIWEAFGGHAIHLELDFDHPAVLAKLPTNTHAARRSVSHNDGWCNRYREYWPKHELLVNKRKAKKWRWWSCVCHRRASPFDDQFVTTEEEPWHDMCKFGVNMHCEFAPGSVPFKCHIGAMGWLLCCRQAYKEGIHVLYSTSSFVLANTELILKLPRLLLPSRLESITRVEMLWKIHPFRDQAPHDPPSSDLQSMLTLTEQTPIIFPSLKKLYVSLQGDLNIAQGHPLPENLIADKIYDKVEEVVMPPVEKMIRSLASLQLCVIAIPASCYAAQKHHAMCHGGEFSEERFLKPERIWRELRDSTSLDGYWLKLGHKDVGFPYWIDMSTADKLRTQQELERLQAKYIGTGHPDTTSWEWRTNIQRDTYSSIAGHRPLLSYIALAENEPVAKVRAQMIRKMVQPCGPPPQRED